MSTQVPASVLSSLDVAAGWRVEVAPEAKLRAILEISRNLGTALDMNVVLPKILESLFTLFPRADRGFILLRDPNTGQLVPRAVRQRREKPGEKPVVSRTIVNYALHTGQAVLCADVGNDDRFDLSLSIRQMQLRSVMCVPLLGQNGSGLGVIQIDTLGKQYLFGQEDLDVMAGAATQAARAVEVAQLHQQLRDLESATQIQKSFLPDAPPSVPGLHFFDHYSPARHVGGDYYDYIPLPGNRLAIALGDVSGKGVPAALLMARLSAAARFCLATAPSVAAAVRELNLSLMRTGTEDRFATFLVIVLDLTRYTMTLVNAGHMPPLRCRPAGGEPQEIGGNEAGLPLATFDQPYDEVVVPLERGDTYLLYTDGVTEARNETGAFYGMERLRKVIERTPADPAVLGHTIVEDVQAFTGDRPPADDIAMVCFSREA
jgi:serine phosphatase RsbU (regulator of sigma subunit)